MTDRMWAGGSDKAERPPRFFLGSSWEEVLGLTAGREGKGCELTSLPVPWSSPSSWDSMGAWGGRGEWSQTRKYCVQFSL